MPMKDDFEWFNQHYQEFQQQYGDAFLAIKNKQVLGVYDSYGKGVRETQKPRSWGHSLCRNAKKTDWLIAGSHR